MSFKERLDKIAKTRWETCDYFGKFALDCQAVEADCEKCRIIKSDFVKIEDVLGLLNESTRQIQDILRKHYFSKSLEITLKEVEKDIVAVLEGKKEA
jgi:hypothetical protein